MSITAAVAAQFKLILLKQCKGNHRDITCDQERGPEMNARCIFHLFTAALGYLLIVTVAIGQIPLLYKIIRFQTGKAYFSPINIASLVLTSSNYVAYAVYRNLPISTWGEGIMQLIQYIIIANLMLLYSQRHKQTVVFMFLYVLVMVVLLWPFVPGWFLVTLKVINIPVYMYRKVNRIYRCHKDKETAPFSRNTSLTLMNFCSFGRLLTSVVDARDFLMVVSYLLECIFSVILTGQALRYCVKRRRLNRDRDFLEQRSSLAG